MKKQITKLATLFTFILVIAGCSTAAGPVLTPPPQGAAHDQVVGAHRGFSPLYSEQLKTPPPYLKHSHQLSH